MASMHDSFYTKNTTLWASPLTSKSSHRGPNHRFDNISSHLSKTRGLQNNMTPLTPRTLNKLYSSSLRPTILMGHNDNQLHLLTPNRFKIPHCLPICQPHSHCSYYDSNPIEFYRRNCPNNCPQPHILLTTLSNKF